MAFNFTGPGTFQYFEVAQPTLFKTIAGKSFDYALFTAIFVFLIEVFRREG